MDESDLDLVLEWRNSPNVRLNMISSKIVSSSEHKLWFLNKSTDKSHRLMIVMKNQIEFGFVQIKINQAENVGEWGFYRDPMSPKGLGMNLARLAINYTFFDLYLQELWGFVVNKNIRSIEFHKKNGFIISDHYHSFEDKKRHPNLLAFCLKRDQWIGNQNYVY